MSQGHTLVGTHIEASSLAPGEEWVSYSWSEGEDSYENVTGSVSPGLCMRLWEYPGHLG